MVLIDEEQSGTSVEVPAGDLLVIRLKENPGTGFRWSIEQADGLKVEEGVDGATVPGAAPGATSGAAPGAALLHEFRFRAPVPGSHQLRLRHWRSWEGEASIIGRFVLDARFN